MFIDKTSLISLLFMGVRLGDVTSLGRQRKGVSSENGVLNELLSSSCTYLIVKKK